jgi:ribosomal protein RSM22 (predicted rRNA methylase)
VRSAYLAHFHPQQVLRGRAALDEVLDRAAARGLSPGEPGRPLRVADLGAGLGALSQSLLCRVAEGDGDWPELALVDHQRSAVADARTLTGDVARALRPDREPPRVRTATDRLDAWLRRAGGAGWRYDVVLLGAVLNEQRGDWGPLLEGVLAVLAPGGVGIVVEPALDETARRLMELREEARGALTTLAPCTHDGACPLLARRRDWCFTVRAARLPQDVRRRAERMGHQSDEVRYALWGFRGGDVGTPRTGPPARVVSDPMGPEQLLCTVEGERRVRPLPGARRGDLAVPVTEQGGSRGRGRP